MEESSGKQDQASRPPDGALEQAAQAGESEWVEAELVEAPEDGAAGGEARPLTVGPAFGILLGTLGACIIAQIPVAVAITAYQTIVDGHPPAADELMATPWHFVAIALPAQLAMLGGWWLATTYGDPRARAFRAIGKTSLGVGAYLCFLPATWAVLELGIPLGTWGEKLFGQWSGDTFSQMYADTSWASGIVLVVFIALAPAIAEELFFRGYLQRRLLTRWRPARAITVVAACFAAFHGTPSWALTVLPLGLWFGILAWRTGSLWPGMLCHAFVNGSVNLWRVGAVQGAWPAVPAPALGYALTAVSAACLLVSIWILARYRQDVAEPAVLAPQSA